LDSGPKGDIGPNISNMESKNSGLYVLYMGIKSKSSKEGIKAVVRIVILFVKSRKKAIPKSTGKSKKRNGNTRNYQKSNIRGVRFKPEIPCNLS